MSGLSMDSGFGFGPVAVGLVHVVVSCQVYLSTGLLSGGECGSLLW